LRPWFLLSFLASCSSTRPPPAAPDGAVPSLVIALADFGRDADGAIELQPARALILRQGADRWWPIEVVDPASNAMHKAIGWRGGLLTIGASRARVVHWSDLRGQPRPQVLWDVSFGGRHDRIRDLEIGDLRGDGRESLVVATHDQGVVAVGHEEGDGWQWTELSRRDRTFVHEIELGDLDGDGLLEIYATPSEPNRASGAAQPGAVERWVPIDGGYRHEVIHAWPDTHAKEILIADLGFGPSLFALREGRVGPGPTLIEPATVVRFVPGVDGWTEQPVAVLLGEQQGRFLVAGDLDGDGAVELIATGMRTGVWRIDHGSAGFSARRVDAGSGGFEQAAHLADLDGDGHPELYVMSEREGEPRELRRYRFASGSMQRDVIYTLPGEGVVWSIDDLRL